LLLYGDKISISGYFIFILIFNYLPYWIKEPISGILRIVMNYYELNSLNKKYPYLFTRLYSPFKPCMDKISHFHNSSLLKKNIKPISDTIPTPANIMGNTKLPILPKKPLEIYENSMIAKKIASKKYAGKAIIYIWFNKITGEYYVGSSYGKTRLEDYFKLWYLNKGFIVCKSILEYGHENHMLIIMEELGDI